MSMITDEIVDFKTAELLRAKGFDLACDLVYDLVRPHSCIDNKVYDNFGIKNHNKSTQLVSAPLLSRAMKWLREAHGLFIEVHIVEHSTAYMDNKYYFYRLYKDRRPLKPVDTMFLTYEDACRDVITNCLENYIIDK